MVKNFFRISLLLAIAFAAASFFAPRFVAYQVDRLFGAHTIGNLTGRLSRMLGETEAGPPPVDRIATTFVPLSVDSVFLPPSVRNGSGGALTAIGDQVLVLDFEGGFYLVDDALSVTKLDLAPPANGFDAYARFSESEEGQAYNHGLHFFRYNDVELLDRESGSSLAVSYTFFDEARLCYTTNIALLEVEAADILANSVGGNAADWSVIYQSKPCLPLKKEYRALEGHMAGGRFAYHPDDVIFIANGDYAWDGMYGPEGVYTSQDPETDYGKVVRIDLATGDSSVVSLGHRNTQGIALDAEGRLWVAEHGMRGGDEMNLIREGRNYGWPLVSFGTNYASLPLPTVQEDEIGRHPGFTRPEIAFLPSLAISSLALVENFHDTWNGDLIIGSLRGQTMVRMRYAQGKVAFTELIEVGRRIRDLINTPDGRIVLWTDRRELVFLSPAEGGLGRKYVDYKLATIEDDETLHNEVKAVVERCNECHSFNRGEHTNAPSLSGVFGREMGSTVFDGYSVELRRDTRVWSAELLEAYLSDPQQVVPGTNMPLVEMSAPARDVLVSLLIGLATQVELPRQYQ